MQSARSAIMIVDDDPFILQTCKAYLEERGYEVLVAQDGQQALEKMSTTEVDTVFLDILMPEKDGIETLLELRKHHPSIWVYAMSGGGRAKLNDFLDVAAKLGADATLRKPFSPDELIDLLEGRPPRKTAASQP